MKGEIKNDSGESVVSQKEKEILNFWIKNKIFDKTLKQTDGGVEYVFYDGPPFATGTPHYGHIVASTIKDTLPRYQTMRGRSVQRRWGWDCHGLPIENLVEKELGLKSKKDIEDYGIENFNRRAREIVLEYVDDWKRIIPRLGRFVDMENDYRTMDWQYSESVIQVFKQLYDKGLIYEGYKSMQICPRCETTLSNFEINQGYKDITDISVTVKFELVDEPGTFILAWTTTPWTLPGNVALAVNSEIDYVKIKWSEKFFILAKTRTEKYFKENFEIVEEIKGRDLVGKSYRPVFDYYLNKKILDNHDNGWKIYDADFVTTENGTGIVHIAPAFGEDDMKLGQREKLPFVQHVFMNGTFKPEVTDFPAEIVKPTSDHQSTDIKIIKYLAEKSVLFSKEKINHSYPHCWRCSTPLLNYATSSWFVGVTKFRDTLIENNKTIGWTPEHIKYGRFGKWLEGARDWAISRSRFWGAPIPAWRCEKCKEVKVLGSIEELKNNLQSRNNNYFLMRHSESENGLGEAMKGLRSAKIDLVIFSDFISAEKTAEVTSQSLDLDKNHIVFDSRLNEYSEGTNDEEDYVLAKQRVGDFIYELNKKYTNKNVLIVSHNLPLFYILAVNSGLNKHEMELLKDQRFFLKAGEVKKIQFQFLPHNEKYELDLHRPYIDMITFSCNCGGEMKRVQEVFDCWFESGSMPYGQAHYPFDNLGIFNPKDDVGFPADFIAEGLDQTRGWFYSMLVLSTALFGKPSYKNVVINGLILAEDGQKMSKGLKNYPDPMELVNRFGADSLRFYLLSSPVMRAEDLNFSEKGVGEMYRKIIMRLNNVYSFYEMYKSKDSVSVIGQSENILDIWINSRFSELTSSVTEALDKFELDRAARPIDEFIDDLSNWYLRRSRDRFKSVDLNDKNWAIATIERTLNSLSKLMAPFTPFIAEDIYLKTGGEKESVHLETWPGVSDFDSKIIEEMSKARELVEIGLALRDKRSLKVRQPVSDFLIGKEYKFNKKILQIISEEMNAKEIKIVDFNNLAAEKYDVYLHTITNAPLAALGYVITDDLKMEGDMRELVRNIQQQRKDNNLKINDVINLKIITNKKGEILVNKFTEEIKRSTGTKDIKLEIKLTESKNNSENFEVVII